ncbi:hypothetical protein [Croceicoccus naphthovorans]|uniref:Uncharacterized protein n=1 Tax=Croceicoccus naphthovorans TaxID=1348774 RepID=A0A0G3XJX6_9SPHN|nr:hypothetical protein [Croceicoccus naphthovorans]AKM10668.1 hypothetical protein AB433_12945 [Croceicoccus naphthovorans]MBB3988904.1 hypothetical protein [Croceicoccus naphthovorans]
MPRFRHFLAIDWSGAAGKRQKGIALGLARADGGAPELLIREGGWSRGDVLALLREDLPEDTLVGMDLGISLPFADCGAFFPGLPDSPADAHALWHLIDDVCAADPHLSATSFVDHPDFAPYFRRHGGREGALFHGHGAPHRRGRFRVAEEAQAALGCQPTSNFNLVGAAQVGKSSLTGMRVLHRLDRKVPVWPIDRLPATGSVITEIYTAIPAIAAARRAGRSKIRSWRELDDALALLGSPALGREGPIDDHASDALLTAAWLRRHADDPALWSPKHLNDAIARTEGWTFGAP